MTLLFESFQGGRNYEHEKLEWDTLRLADPDGVDNFSHA